MVLRTTAAGLLAMMTTRARDEADTAWLLYGPTDPEVVEAAEADPPLLLAAE